ncbi:MAG: hypothetical protein Kow001_14410 [Acidobacteriota bacterium]
MTREKDPSPSYEELLERLGQLQATLEALRRGEADLLIGESGPVVVRLKTLVEEKERLAAETERLARQWQLTFDSSRDAILILDAHQRVTRANRAAETIFQCSLEEILGRGFWELAGRDSDRTSSQVREEVLPDRVGEVMEVRCGDRWLAIVTDPVQGPADPTTVFIAHVRDVTDRKRMELERSRLETQLLQAQKLEAIGRLAGGLAHDFNNMLSVILGCGEQLLDQLHSGDPLAEDVREIVEAARRSATMTRQLLAFSKRQPLKPEVVSLNQHLKEMERMLRRLIGEDIRLELSLKDDLGPVSVDPGQIDQVILNLVVNARDAMPEGGELTITTDNVELDSSYAGVHPEVVPGPYVLLAVTDTGRGMEPEVKDRIFEPFFTTKGGEKGTGLGLSTAYGIVKQSGGHIWVYSEPGRGTTFKVYLPRTEAAAAPDIAPQEQGRPGAGEHVLVVEDDGALRLLLKRMLTRLGYRVTVAANGGEALLLMEERGLEPDLLMTDVVMPGMSGALLAERLQRFRPGLRVLYMSGYTGDTVVHHTGMEPGTPFLQKPFSIRDLAVQLRKVLS